MDDLMGKIQEVLSDEESMKQLSELAASLFPSSDRMEQRTAALTKLRLMRLMKIRKTIRLNRELILI